MEINVALDELLGLRGPLSTLVRNLLWLLAFNATYLGIFAFVPKAVGSAVYSGVLNTTVFDKLLKTIPYVHSENEDDATLLNIISSLNAESIGRDTTFRLPDITIMTLGYFSIAAMIVMMRFFWVFSQKFRQRLSVDEQRPGRSPNARLGDAIRRVRQVNERDELEEAGTTVEVALDATVAVVKVGILLFLKMFMLPLMLGLWLDVSTMPLFGHTVSRRIEFAGGDIFAFMLLHWVAGITFMLLVTVFLLQLREVAHPDLLAGVIRPQEPQPDLLGNLMHETVGTHMKRMFLSLGIYGPLLTIHVYLPVKIFAATGLGDTFTFFHLKFWHMVMPQLQIPFELVIFHLSMLALLERYKNSIGGLQHSWMVFMCKHMDLTAHILPHNVDKFQLAGTREIFVTGNEDETKVDPFWYELAAREKYIDYFVESNIDKPKATTTTFAGESKSNGERVLDSSLGFIHLPENLVADDGEYLLPAKRGRFCLRRVEGNDDTPPQIEFWEEVRGDEIPRPPEGWDDLGAGGAYVQGRWAWGKERRSVIEGSVAQRTPFRVSKNHRRPLGLLLKVAALLFLSWVAITFAIVGLAGAPLAVGRSFYYLFRIPEKYIHDPLAFCIGSSVLFPVMALLIKNMKDVVGSPAKNFREWLSRFHLPPARKLVVFLESVVLWNAVSPLALGATYELVVVKTSKWFEEKEPLVDAKSILLCWLVGTVVLNIWAFDSYNNFFTRDFWANFWNAVVDPPEENVAGNVANEDENDGTADNANGSWQGKTGRVARFFSIWRSVLLKWEWDTVDRVALLDDFARPITRQVASALVGSSLSWQFAIYLAPLVLQVEKGGFVLPFFGLVERGVFRMMLFRMCTLIHVGIQLCSAHRGRIEKGFQVAHEAARDDRYLVGEILMNYDPNDENFE
jgi:E3 ubiquitin-protein ligase MARCH6